MSTERGSSFLEHIDELRSRIIKIVIVVALVSVISFTFGIKEVVISDLRFWILLPDPTNNIASSVLRALTVSLLPPGVKLIQTAPAQVFLAELQIAFMIGILIGLPYIAYHIAKFVGPGLYPKEQRMIMSVIIPIVLLFITGAIFSYVVIIPYSLLFLYSFASGLPIETFVTISDFIGFVLTFIIGVGLSFELPVIMYVLTKMDVVDAAFWRRNMAYAVFGAALYGTIITPDGSGVTMWFVAAPMMALYLAGYVFIALRNRKAKV